MMKRAIAILMTLYLCSCSEKNDSIDASVEDVVSTDEIKVVVNDNSILSLIGEDVIEDNCDYKEEYLSKSKEIINSDTYTIKAVCIDTMNIEPHQYGINLIKDGDTGDYCYKTSLFGVDYDVYHIDGKYYKFVDQDTYITSVDEPVCYDHDFIKSAIMGYVENVSLVRYIDSEFYRINVYIDNNILNKYQAYIFIDSTTYELKTIYYINGDVYYNLSFEEFRNTIDSKISLPVNSKEFSVDNTIDINTFE